jgi:hypothetical protein
MDERNKEFVFSVHNTIADSPDFVKGVGEKKWPCDI